MTERPPIKISSLDADRLEQLLETRTRGNFPGKDDLQEELDRAEVVPPEEMPPDVVTMNSTVTFRVESSSQEFSLTLVYPQDADGGEARISVLAPVGSALLGLREGDRISWPRPRGGSLRVTIIKVTFQPERTGDYTH
jgi:regulator of nucleoside diphosphate kinase